ncbi:hypothetical protein ACFO8O_07040 [Hephaestia sp. GCM10023244]|uniref:hypothetical protein n=1 Tax=unclassified Hephaestia TaxID=2631281 RepID=UPI002077002F|nr:hypothetical protein [Hephaestia sp. MAHUQ-44]MCM8730724.1 hypothetical protein [Hephaestia sp. MAHUQ-44]
MNTLSFTAAAAAILLLAGCQQKAETVDTTAPDPMAAELANAPAVELPPSMKASVAFRCKDNSLAFVDFFSGDKLANLRTKKDGEIIHLTAANAGDPLTNEGGYKLTGDQKSITLTTPSGTQTCKH